MGRATIPGFKIIVKPRKIMGDYIALHGKVPKNELPKNLRGKIPKNEVWVRGDIYRNPIRRRQILQIHEKRELYLMKGNKFYTYKKAHKEATERELLWFIPLIEQDLTPTYVQKEIKKQSKNFLNKKIKRMKK
jgi:hypothetical protein